jgi:hypothetical protein
MSWAIGNVLADGVVVVNFFLASPELTVALWVWLVIAPTTIFINVVSGIYTPPKATRKNQTQSGWQGRMSGDVLESGSCGGPTGRPRGPERNVCCNILQV